MKGWGSRWFMREPVVLFPQVAWLNLRLCLAQDDLNREREEHRKTLITLRLFKDRCAEIETELLDLKQQQGTRKEYLPND